jgi:hypothetical protein
MPAIFCFSKLLKNRGHGPHLQNFHKLTIIARLVNLFVANKYYWNAANRLAKKLIRPTPYAGGTHRFGRI